MKLGPGSFAPAPKVDSAVLVFEPNPDPLPRRERAAFLDFLHRSFAHRRKTLMNNWQGWMGREAAGALLERGGIPHATRPEAVDVPTWRVLWSLHKETR
jgi:16S rRNA (adenine1518-N6/adenine1519-N6)-dimethyltransferase